MNRKTYHVTPVGARWRVKRAGAGRADSLHGTKATQSIVPRLWPVALRWAKSRCIGEMGGFRRSTHSAATLDDPWLDETTSSRWPRPSRREIPRYCISPL